MSSYRRRRSSGARISAELSLLTAESVISTTDTNSASQADYSLRSVYSISEINVEELENKIIYATKAARKKKPGRNIESIKKNPKRFGGEAKSERGPCLLTKHIVLGGRDDASSLEVLNEMGITHILNMAQQLPCYHEATKKFIYLHIPLQDTVDTDVTAVMPVAARFIKNVEAKGGRVLIHCISGVSRSVTVALMYLVIQHRIQLIFAFGYMKQVSFT